MLFRPKAGDILELDLNGSTCPFSFKEHPGTPPAAKVPHSMCGERSTVYHVVHKVPGGREYALKVMNKIHQNPNIPAICDFLGTLRHIPGLECCNRVCLTRDRCRTIATYPELEFAILMPWTKGTSWFDAHHKDAHSSTNELSPWQAFSLARALAAVLATLETRGLLHCSISPSNVFVTTDSEPFQVSLLGLEGIRGGGLPVSRQSQKSPYGYTHSLTDTSGSEALSARFAGGLLLAEILSWANIERQHLFSAECYFDPAEMNDSSSERFQVLSAFVAGQHEALSQLLHKVWRSRSENDCPAFVEWYTVLEKVAATKIAYAWFSAEEAGPGHATRREPSSGDMSLMSLLGLVTLSEQQPGGLND